jgi:putative molybdopterin biosynthesis protein
MSTLHLSGMTRADRLSSRLRVERVARGLSQEKLARRAGITRQSYAAIEAGTSIPATDVALRLARALSTSVEGLFRLAGDDGPAVEVDHIGAPLTGPSRVRLARVAGKVRAYPVGGRTLGPADGIATPLEGRRVRVRRSDRSPPEADLVVLGCDPSFSLVSDHLRRARGVEVLWVHRGSRGALEALAEGQAHVIGMHLRDERTGAYNAPWVRRHVPFECTLVRFAEWEQELLVAAGNALGISAVGDLARPGVRFVNREPGSGSRTLLDRLLADAGVPGEAITGYGSTAATGHLTVAETIASGAADAGVALRAAGLAFGLSGLPLATEPYDLVIPNHFLDHPGVQALLESLRDRSLRSQVELLGGYDVASMGLP